MLVKLLDKVDNYLDAIKISCDMLEAEGIVEKRYYDAIVNKIEEFGPYFCIAEDICMPHARPEDGAIEEGLCIIKLNEPVDFMGKTVRVFFTLSAKDNESHLGLMRKIADVCMNKDKFNNLLKVETEEQLMEVF